MVRVRRRCKRKEKKQRDWTRRLAERDKVICAADCTHEVIGDI